MPYKPTCRSKFEFIVSNTCTRHNSFVTKINLLSPQAQNLGVRMLGNSVTRLELHSTSGLSVAVLYIHALGSTRDTRALVAAIPSIANEFGMDTVTQGVETKARARDAQISWFRQRSGLVVRPHHVRTRARSVVKTRQS